ncbi:MAG: ABC transporter permease, partial [Bacteroidia bacterium]
MLKNYLKIAWRNLLNNKFYSFINIAGLSIGIACCVIIYLFVRNELSYDTFNEKADRIFRVTLVLNQPKEVIDAAASSPIVAPKLKSGFPEVNAFVRLKSSKRLLSYNQNKFYDTDTFYADSTFFDVFTYPLLQGDAKRALTAPYSIVLTEAAAKRYFGNENAFGKTMKLSDTISLLVTGIIKDEPRNSHLKFDYLVSRTTINDLAKNDSGFVQNSEANWFNVDSYSYLLLNDNADEKKLEAKMNTFIEKEMADVRKSVGIWFNVKLQPVKDIHLRSHLKFELSEAQGDIKYIYIFSGTAVLILLIACCNFINLSTARSLNRSKEIGLRKVIGAERSQLIAQFLGESVLFSLIASILSLVIVLLALPFFNSFLSAELSFSKSLIPLYCLIIIVVGFLAGLYPALLMSSFAPIRSLKGHIRHGIQDILFRKGLVVFQFTIAIILIIGTETILKQLNFMQDKDIGMRKAQLVQLELKAADMKKAKTLIKELSRNSNVEIASSNNFSFKSIPYITLQPEGAAQNEITASSVICGDESFLSTYHIQLVCGRNFSPDFPSDIDDAFLVNEAGVKEFGWKSPKLALGKKIDWGGGKSGKVIGVVKDFNYSSLHENVKPVIIHIFPGWQKYITLRLKSGHISETMSDIEKTWKGIVSDSPFKYSFLEEDFANLYKGEQNMKAVLSTFAFLSV